MDKQIHFFIPVEEYEALLERCKVNDVTVSQKIRQLIRKYVGIKTSTVRRRNVENGDDQTEDS